MNAPVRTSPLHSALSELAAQWTTINQMQVAAHIGTPAEERAKQQSIALTDLSHRKRCGLKGPGAEAWLKSVDIEPAAGINQWAPLEKFGLVVRLATSEFLVEDNIGQDHADRLRAQLGGGLPGVTPVLRQDAAMALAGRRVNELLLQTRSFNFAALNLSTRPIVMTSIIGVSALVIPGTRDGGSFYRLWCDATYALYLWQHLIQIAEELGGGAVGLAALFPNTELEH